MASSSSEKRVPQIVQNFAPGRLGALQWGQRSMAFLPWPGIAHRGAAANTSHGMVHRLA
jgi:hypothetical protein